MARSCARTRACDFCRSRKKKCDEKTPTCSQCKKAGANCSGPVSGALIVAFKPHDNPPDEAPQEPQERPQKGRSAPFKKSLENGQRNVDTLQSPRRSKDRYLIESYDIKGPLQDVVNLSSLTIKFSELFLVPSARSGSLISSLPALAASSSLPFLRLSIMACAKMLGGVLMKDKAYCLKADQTYGLVLSGLRTHLFNLKKPCYEASLEMICVSAILVYYTGVRNWDTAAACQHAAGTARMISTRNPADFQTGLAHEAFRTVRAMLLNSHIFFPEPVPLATDLWLTIPFSSKTKSSFDNLIDLMLFIPSLLSRVLQFCTVDRFRPSSDRIKDLTDDLESLDQKLLAWWLNYETGMTGSDGEGWLYYDLADDWVDSDGKYHPKQRHFRHDSIFESVFYYELSQFLITIVRALFCEEVKHLACRRQALEHSTSIFAAATYPHDRVWEGYPTSYLAFLSLLQVVSLGSPDQTHRDFATKACEIFSKPTPLSAIISTSPTLPFWEIFKKVWDGTLELPIIQPG